MKFLCDSCKAKYQIADEKVAGKTVRMKCRKCGHQIEVRAAVTETSVAKEAPKAPNAPKTPQRSGLATSLSATKPRAATPSRPPPGGGALGAAFQRNVNDAPASSSSGVPTAQIELSVTDEWYVAINGVPVGPVRISELRRKAAAGAVTEESLCWQEGLEEWRPIKSIPDLAALVREAALGNRPSLISSPDAMLPGSPAAWSPSAPSAPKQRASAPPPRPVSSPSAPINTAPIPMTPQPAPARSNVVPIRPAASSGLDDVASLGSLMAGGNALAPAIQPERAPSFAPPPPAADPFAVPPAPFGGPGMPAQYRDSGIAPSLAPPPASAYAAEQKRSGGVPLWFWPILVLALGFGGGVAFLVFRPQPTPAPVVIQMQPTATAAPASSERAGDVPPPPAATEAAAPPDAKPTGKTAVAAKGAPAAKPAPGEEKKGLDLGGLVSGNGGPNVGPGSAAAGGGGGLDQAGVERVVAAHRNGVKRTCWERGGDQKSSVNVTVTATVAPDGSVSNATSSGDDPVVAKCIENQVKTWKFSAPGATTTINVPFKFVRQ